MKALVKKLLILFMWYPLRIAIAFLPLPLVARIGRGGGRVLHLLSREKRGVMLEEFRRVLPGRSEPELIALVRESFANYCCSELEVLLYPSMDRRYIDRVFVIEGKEHLDAALARGRGVLLYQAHFGAFQMTMPAIGYSGYSMNQISASASVWKDGNASAAGNRMMDIKARYEYTLPVRHIPIASSLRPVFRALERNEIVGITVDGGGGRKIVPLRFLGRDSFFQTGPADLAIRTGAAIVPAFVTTEPGLRHRLVLHPPIAVDEGLAKEEGRLAILRVFVSLLESHVMRRPDHYGYTLCLRRLRARVDPYAFFADYGDPAGAGEGINTQWKADAHAEKE